MTSAKELFFAKWFFYAERLSMVDEGADDSQPLCRATAELFG